MSMILMNDSRLLKWEQKSAANFDKNNYVDNKRLKKVHDNKQIKT